LITPDPVKNLIGLSFIITLFACQKDNLSTLQPGLLPGDYILAGDDGSGISYHDIHPDWDRYAYGLAGDSIVLDINADQVNDISIKYSTGTSASQYVAQTTVTCLNNASVSLAPKNQGDTISSTSGWTSAPSLLCYTKIDFASGDTSLLGQWHSVKDKYLGVRIVKNGITRYAWIRMTLLVHPATVYVQEIIVKDFGYRRP